MRKLRIAFLLERRSYYRIYGSIIHAMIKWGWGVLLIHCDASLNDKRKRLALDESEVKSAFPGELKIVTTTDLNVMGRHIHEDSCDMVIGLSPKIFPDLRKVVGEKCLFGIHEASPLDFLSSFKTPDEVKAVDLIWMSSQYWKTQAVRVSNEIKSSLWGEEILKEFCDKMTVTGWPRGDQKTMFKKSCQNNEKKSKRPYVLMCSWVAMPEFGIGFGLYPEVGMKSRISTLKKYDTGFFKKIIELTEPSIDGVVRQVRNFCDEVGADLVFKTRECDKLHPSEEKVADRIVGDKQLFPASIISAVAEAEIVVSYFSFVAREAALLEKPFLTVDISGSKNLSVHGEKTPLGEEYFKNQGMFNYRGVSYRGNPKNLADSLRKMWKTRNEHQDDFENYMQIYGGVGEVSETHYFLEDCLKRVIQKQTV